MVGAGNAKIFKIVFSKPANFSSLQWKSTKESKEAYGG